MKTHHIDPEGAVAWSRKNGRIAIGWGRVGDITKYKSQSEIKEAIRSCYPVPQYSNNAHLGAPSLWDLCHTMQKDDLVILSGRAPRELVVEVIGDYRFITEETPTQTDEGEYYNQRTVRVTEFDPNKLWFAAGQAPGEHRYKTLIKCARSLNLGEL